MSKDWYDRPQVEVDIVIDYDLGTPRHKNGQMEKRSS